MGEPSLILLSLTRTYGWHNAINIETTGRHVACMRFNGATVEQVDRAIDKAWDCDSWGWESFRAVVLNVAEDVSAELAPFRDRGLLVAPNWEGELTYVRACDLRRVKLANFEWVKALRPEMVSA